MLRSIALSLISLREAKLGWGAAALMFPHPRSSENPQSLRGIDNFGVQRSEFYHINFLVVTNFHHAPGANKKSWLQLNPNLEIRNSKQIQNTNAPMLKTRAQRPWFWSFEFGSLEIVSDFVLRISDFLFSVPGDKVSERDSNSDISPKRMGLFFWNK
jgi:hypothetical protein